MISSRLENYVFVFYTYVRTFICYLILPYRMVKNVRKKISITIDEELTKQLEKEAKKKNLSLSRLIENKLKGV